MNKPENFGFKKPFVVHTKRRKVNSEDRQFNWQAYAQQAARDFKRYQEND